MRFGQALEHMFSSIESLNVDRSGPLGESLNSVRCHPSMVCSKLWTVDNMLRSKRCEFIDLSLDMSLEFHVRILMHNVLLCHSSARIYFNICTVSVNGFWTSHNFNTQFGCSPRLNTQWLTRSSAFHSHTFSCNGIFNAFFLSLK